MMFQRASHLMTKFAKTLHAKLIHIPLFFFRCFVLQTLRHAVAVDQVCPSASEVSPGRFGDFDPDSPSGCGKEQKHIKRH